ncbi:MAG: L-dopachrome tautomerase-related protein [Microcoleaceae cyanobacterium]
MLSLIQGLTIGVQGLGLVIGINLTGAFLGKPPKPQLVQSVRGVHLTQVLPNPAVELGEPVEIVAKLSQGPGNITITPDGRIFISLHQFYATTDRVVELKPDGQLTPFPNIAWTRGRNTDGTGLDTVLGIQSDGNDIVWMLDNGMRGQVTPQLVGWNTRTNRLERMIPLPSPVTAKNSFLNDLAVDPTHQTIYIADTTQGGVPALIVVDLKTDKARRILAGHVSVLPEKLDLIIDGQPVQVVQPDGTLARPQIGVNPIALDAKNEWLYYGPMHGRHLFRVQTSDILNPDLKPDQLAQRVETYAEKPICDGISIDQAGNIYITDIGANAIGVIRPDRTYQRLVSAPWLSWPDAFSFSPDGYLYGVVNQLHRTPVLNAGVDATQPPFLIIRLKPLAPGVAGR